MASSHLCYFPQILKDRNLNQYVTVTIRTCDKNMIPIADNFLYSIPFNS